MDSLIFGSTLRMLRTTAGITLRTMAKKIQVSPAYLSQIEMGKLPPPTFNRIEKIARVIGIPLASLLEMSERINPEILALLQSHPELARLIQFSVEIGLDSNDVQEIMKALGELGLTGFRNLLRYGHEHLTEFKSDRLNESYLKAFQKYDQSIHFRESIDPELVFPDLFPADKNKVLHFLVQKSCQKFPSIDADNIFGSLIAGELESTSGIGNGVAIPHLFIKGIDKRILSIARIPKGINFDAIDDKPVYLVCLILDTEKAHRSHLKLLAFLARQFHHPGLMDNIKKAKTKEQILSLMFDMRLPSLN